MMDDIAIKVDHVGKTFKLPHEKSTSLKSRLINFRKRGYETQKVLKDISFEIKKGEFFGIVGRNGSGKSTLLKMLAGIYTPTEGGIQVNGKLTPFIELGVGFNPELTGRENVFLNGALLGFSRKEMEVMYDDIVAFAEIERFMDQKLKNYSSGMQVRLAFSIAIRARSDILVLDEVLAVGDAAFQQKCEEYFREIKNSKQTVVLVTHDMKSVEKYCDRAMLIDAGHVLEMGKPRVVAEAYTDINMKVDSDAGMPTPSHEQKIEAGADFVKVSTADESGTETKAYKYKDTIRLAVSYRLKKDLAQGSIDIGLTFGNNGPLYFYVDTKQHKKVVTGKAGDIVSVICEVKNIFNQGTFYLVSSLYDADTLEVYARDRQLAKLRFGELPTSGYVAPEHTLKVIKDAK